MARDEHARLEPVEKDLDDEEVTDHDIEDHRCAVRVPRVPRVGRVEVEDRRGHDRVEDLEEEHLEEARELLRAEGVVVLELVGACWRMPELAHAQERQWF